MLTEEELNHQRVLLTTYRDNIKHLLLQAAQHGGESNAPLILANSLREQRANKQRIKEILLNGLSRWRAQCDRTNPLNSFSESVDSSLG